MYHVSGYQCTVSLNDSFLYDVLLNLHLNDNNINNINNINNNMGIIKPFYKLFIS